jgi:hypothetical protein
LFSHKINCYYKIKDSYILGIFSVKKEIKMKNIVKIALALALLMPFQASFAKTEKSEKSKTHKTHKAKGARYKASKTHSRAKPAKSSQTAAKRKHEPRKSATAYKQPAATKRKSWTQRAGEYLGTTGAGAAAATAAKSYGKETHKHYGPHNWHHNFPATWDKGFTWGNLGGHRVFAGYAPEWWETNYPEYYKNVVRKEFNETYKK